MPSTTYYWDEDDDNVCCEEDENGEITASYTHEPGLYGELIAQKRGDEVRYSNFDGEGNTCELTDEDENVTDTYEYSAFGEEVARTGTTENPFGYKGALGYYTDGETYDISVRARKYEPKIGRWLSSDPMWTAVPAESKYQYTGNSPVVVVDPSGLCYVCGWMLNWSGDLVADLDKQLIQPANLYTELAQHAHRLFHVGAQSFKAMSLGQPPLDPFAKTGPYAINNKDGLFFGTRNVFYPATTREHAGHLFFISADICDSPGNRCRVRFSEKTHQEDFILLSSGTWFRIDKEDRSTDDPVDPYAAHDFRVGKLATATSNDGIRCDKRIVYVDMPQQVAIRPFSQGGRMDGQVTIKNIIQELQVYGSKDPSTPVAFFRHTMDLYHQKKPFGFRSFTHARRESSSNAEKTGGCC